MTTPGRPRHPVKAHKLRGTTPKYDIDDMEDLGLEAGVPPMPKWLPTEAKRHYFELQPELEKMGRCTSVDGPLLAMMAVYFAQFIEAALAVSKEGASVLTPGGCPIHNPNVTARDNAAAQYLKLAVQYGLSPASRLKLGLEFS